MRGALGDVGGRQPRDHPAAVRELDELLDALDGRQEVAVLRARRPWAGRSCPTCRSASACRRAAIAATDASTSKPSPEPSTVGQRASVPSGALAVDDDHVLHARQLLAGGQHLRQERLLADHDARLRVAHDVGDLVGRVVW